VGPCVILGLSPVHLDDGVTSNCAVKNANTAVTYNSKWAREVFLKAP